MDSCCKQCTFICEIQWVLSIEFNTLHLWKWYIKNNGKKSVMTPDLSLYMIRKNACTRKEQSGAFFVFATKPKTSCARSFWFCLFCPCVLGRSADYNYIAPYNPWQNIISSFTAELTWTFFLKQRIWQGVTSASRARKCQLSYFRQVGKGRTGGLQSRCAWSAKFSSRVCQCR